MNPRKKKPYIWKFKSEFLKNHISKGKLETILNCMKMKILQLKLMKKMRGSFEGINGFHYKRGDIKN